MKLNNKIRLGTLAMAMGMVLGGQALAGDTAQQTVTYEVTAINEISVSGNPGALTVSAATAGSQPDAVSDNTTSWAITTNAGTDAKKLTAAIDSDMPAGVTLTVNVAAPSGGTSMGAVTLSSVAGDVVTAIDSVAESGLGITYGLSATVSAGVVTAANKTVTFTLTDSI